MRSRYSYIFSLFVVPPVAFFKTPIILCYYLFDLVYSPPIFALNKYYTTRIDLMPHTEQVVFHKSSFLGEAKRFIVDIKDLKHIHWKDVPYSFFMWRLPSIDKQMVFKDERSGEIFIMDTSGVWSQNGVDHPLIR